MLTIQYEGDAKKDAEKLGAIEQRALSLRKPLSEFGAYMTSSIKRRFTRGRDAAAGEPPTVRTGLLRQSIVWKLMGEDAVAVGTNRPQGGILHFGGAINAKPGKALAVPIHPESIRGTRRGKRVADFGQLFLITLKKRAAGDHAGGYLVRSVTAGRGRKKQTSLVFLFKLVKRVVIKPHPYLQQTAENLEKLDRILRAWIIKGRSNAPGDIGDA